MKKTSIALVFAFLSQSALANDDFVINNLDILTYQGSYDYIGFHTEGSDNWSASYDYAKRKGDEYQVQLRVKPVLNHHFSLDFPAEESNLLIGPFTLPITAEAYERFSEVPAELPEFLNNVLPMMPLYIWGERVDSNVQNITFDESTQEIVIKFDFETKENIEYLPIVAGFTGFWTKGVQNPTVSVAIKSISENSLTCDKVSKMCNVALVKTSDPASQMFTISNEK